MRNQASLTLVMVAHKLCGRAAISCWDRYRLLHVAARLATRGRDLHLRIDGSWLLRNALTGAFTRLRAALCWRRDLGLRPPGTSNQGARIDRDCMPMIDDVLGAITTARDHHRDPGRSLKPALRSLDEHSRLKRGTLGAKLFGQTPAKSSLSIAPWPWRSWLRPRLRPERAGISAGSSFENGAAWHFRRSSRPFSRSAMRASRAAKASRGRAISASARSRSAASRLISPEGVISGSESSLRPHQRPLDGHGQLVDAAIQVSTG